MWREGTYRSMIGAVETLTTKIYISFGKDILTGNIVLDDPFEQSLISRATVALGDTDTVYIPPDPLHNDLWSVWRL